MRLLGRALLAALLLVLVFGGGAHLWGAWTDWQRLQPKGSSKLDQRVLFEAERGGWLRFNTSTNQGWLALQGFVLAPAQARSRGVPLTIEIELRGASGTPLQRERRYLELRPTTQAQPYGLLDGRAGSPVWIVPAEWVDLTERPEVRSVAVRLVDGSDVRMLWRVAIDIRLDDAQTRLRYRRLDGAARDALTDAWVTPGALVDAELKQELVRYRLFRIGPLGRAEVDFATRQVLRVPPRPRVRTHVERFHAIALDPQLRVSFGLEQAGRVLVDARTPDGGPMPVTLISPTGAIRSRTLEAGQLDAVLPAGLYELQAEERGEVAVRDAVSGDPLLPDGLRQRAHVATPSSGLVYRLQAVAGRIPPVRLELRPQQPGDAMATVGFRAKDGKLLESRRVAVAWSASRYDRVDGALDRPAGEPVTFDLQPPEGARTLRIEADASLLAIAYTSVPTVRRDAATASRMRWFSFLPELDPPGDGRARAMIPGVVVVEQPRADAPASRSVPRGRVPRSPDRPVLRLRPDPSGGSDA